MRIIAVIPFSVLLGGDNDLTAGALTLIYFISLGLAPAIVWVFVRGHVDILSFVRVLVLMILLPLGLSRLLIKADIDRRIGDWKEVIVVMCFFVLIFVLLGAARQSAMELSAWLLPIAVLLTLRTFVTGLVVAVLARSHGLGADRTMSYTLFASFKNGGLTAVIAFTLFGSVAALPGVLTPFFDFPAFLFYQYLQHHGYFGTTNRSETVEPSASTQKTL